MNNDVPYSKRWATRKEVEAMLKTLSTAQFELTFILAFNCFSLPGYRIAQVAKRLAQLRGESQPRLNRSAVSNAAARLIEEDLLDEVKGSLCITEHWGWSLVRYGIDEIDEIKHYEKALNLEVPYSAWDYRRIGAGLQIRILQFSLLTADEYQLRQVLNPTWTSQEQKEVSDHWLQRVLVDPIDEELLQRHTLANQIKLLLRIVFLKIDDLQPVQALLQDLTRRLEQFGQSPSAELAAATTEAFLGTGHPKNMMVVAHRWANLNPGWVSLTEATAAFLAGDADAANKLFATASRKLKARGYFAGRPALFHGWNALTLRDFAKLERYVHKISPYRQDLQALKAVGDFLQNDTEYAEDSLRRLQLSDPEEYLLSLMAHYWCDLEPPNSLLIELRKIYRRISPEEYPLHAQLAQELFDVFLDENSDQRYLPIQPGIAPLLPRIPRTESWERALNSISDLLGSGSTAAPTQNQYRLTWRIDFRYNRVSPYLQKLSKNGSWTKGRAVALKRLHTNDVEGLAPQDYRVAGLVTRQSGWYYSGEEYQLEFNDAIKALVGHPLLFLEESPTVPVELVAKEPQLIVTETDKGIKLTMDPPIEGDGVQLIKETNTRYQVLTVSESQAHLASVMRNGKLTIPKQGKKKLEKVMSNIAQVIAVQSDLEGQAADLPEVKADPRPYVLIVPVGDAFRVEVMAKPFQKEAPYFKPGKGRAKLIAEVSGKQVTTERKLRQEKTQANKLVKECPTLERSASTDWEWYLDDQEDCLNLLLELNEWRAQEKAVLEWPKGEKLRLSGQADFGELNLKVKGRQDWFKLEGELKVDENQVIELQQLLSLLDGPVDTRFITLDDGSFLALTDQLRKRLKELAAYAQADKEGLGLHPLMADNLEEMGELGAKLKANAAWKRQVQRLKDARNYQPELPHGFQADLRPYQEEGYNWLSRLAHWGVGACLADDMGLGKTIQALALLQKRAPDGPALVVAPASVVRNWLREAEKFAPELRPILLSETHRAEAIADLQPYDLLLVSYTLLQIEAEKLEAVTFGTIVLDEAQAIKNRQTKRSKAAKRLQGNFRLITTGTPIENHLGELWNLFDFLNPGFLGSAEHFQERFANPIEKNNDAERRQQLRKLLRPFILRRRKSEVLDDLPEKTEITLHVELSQAERSFYEALRREALTKLSQTEGGNPGEQRMKILAEITRLRQAACHPQLVSPELELSSSKLQLFGETLLELRQNGHKALVFSQFVKHLRLVEEWIQEQGITYQYLDGQTPMKQREARVKAFQQGEGDVFLISLKAGGVGLNLTAADYVIHLDPWWNPAVEDQASDRAHRIGQQRPVTVYRLVAEETIEEKIVRLHSQKRELADSLLEGTDSGARLSSDELLALITEGN